MLHPVWIDGMAREAQILTCVRELCPAVGLCTQFFISVSHWTHACCSIYMAAHLKTLHIIRCWAVVRINRSVWPAAKLIPSYLLEGVLFLSRHRDIQCNRPLLTVSKTGAEPSSHNTLGLCATTPQPLFLSLVIILTFFSCEEGSWEREREDINISRHYFNFLIFQSLSSIIL